MATPTVEVNPNIIRWAIDRSGVSVEDLRKTFGKLDEWLTGDKHPTFRQLENFAKKTMTPFGYLFLENPPDEELPITDFRTQGDSPIDRPSPNLIDTIHLMQRRQAWMRERLIDQGQEKLKLVGSGTKTTNFKSLAQRIRQELDLATDWAEPLSSWEAALQLLRNAIEGAGILVFSNSVVGMNNYRGLDPEEFRGFVLCDDFAPLIFVNSADSKSAQMFTLAHELAHVWLNSDGLFNLIHMMPHDAKVERFCNRVAAEFLVPGYKFTERWSEAKKAKNPFQELANCFKVSPVVVARRALELRLITKPAFFRFYEAEKEEWVRRKAEQKQNRGSGGPSPYVVADSRLSRRFVNAVMTSTREGRILYREAYGLVGMKGETFKRYSEIVAQRIKDERQ